MPLVGLHVTCGFVGIKAGTSLLAASSWSQTMASAGTTARPAVEPNLPRQQFDALLLGFEVTPAADSYVAVGPSPDATQTSGVNSATTSAARIFVPAGQTRNIFCSSGDLLAWAPVP